MTSLLVGLLLGTQDLPIETVDISGQGVPLVFPNAAGPCGAWTAHVEHEGFKYEVRADGSLGRKYVEDGGWGDIRARWAAAKGVPNRRPLHIKVVVPTRVYILDFGRDGIVSQRRGFIERPALDTVYRSLALLKAMIDGSGEGTVDTKFHVEVDDDPRFFALETPGQEVPDDEIVPDVAALLNAAPFATDDGTYHGPYMSTFIIHAGLTGSARDTRVRYTPVTYLPYFGLDGFSPDEALATTMYRSFRRHLFLQRTGSTMDLPSEVTTEPTVDGGPIWKSWLSTPYLDPLRPLLPSDITAGGESKDVLVEHADVVLARGGGRIVAEGRAPSVVVTGSSELDFKASVTPAGAPAPEAVTPRSVGLHKVAVGNDAGTFTIERQSRQSRGYGAFLVSPAEAVSFRVRAQRGEAWFVTLVASNGTSRETLLVGRETVPMEAPADSSPGEPFVPADAEWHEVTFTASHYGLPDIAEVRVGAGTRSWMFERDDPGPAGIEVSTPTPSQGEQSHTVAPPDPDERLAALARIQEPASPEDLSAIQAAFGATTTAMKLNALGAVYRARVPGFLPELTDQSRSALASTTFLAVRILTERTDAESKALASETLERAPFEHGKRFILEAYRGKFPDSMAAAVSQLGARSWGVRLAGILALGAMQGQAAKILLATSFSDEPNAQVRAQAARLLDPSVALVARRLQYAAVNDPSEVVRIECLASLLDCNDRGILRDAHNGVRDESPAVRIELLQRIIARANDADRPALRLAVTDPSPMVRALALIGFAAQPGPVKPEEVANVKDDADPSVRNAYSALAKKKGF